MFERLEWFLAWKAQQGLGQALGQRPRMEGTMKVLTGCCQLQAKMPVLWSYFP